MVIPTYVTHKYTLFFIVVGVYPIETPR